MLRVLNAEYDQLMVMARMNVGALRCHVHLRRRRTGFSTLVGEQPWSNHPLVNLLDRTQQFIGPKGQTIVLGASLNLDWVHCVSSKCLLQKSFDWKLRAPPGCAKKVSIILHRFPEIRSLALATSAQTHVLARYASLPRIAPRKSSGNFHLTVFFSF